MSGLSGAGTPASSVFVGNLAYDLSEQEVIDYFSQVGPVKSVRIATDRETGKPRGFGFIEFFDVATAESAVRNLNGSELNSRTMRIVFAESNTIDRQQDAKDPRSRQAGSRSRAIGNDAAEHAALGMGQILGDDPNAELTHLASLLARKNKNDLYEYLAQLQKLYNDNPDHAQQFLTENSQLARAIFLIEIILGLVGNPLGPSPAKAAQKHGIPADLNRPATAIGSDSVPMPAPADPRRSNGVLAAPVPMVAAPRPMVSMASRTHVPGAASVPGMSPEQQQALLQQVMGLTPEQMELLPPQQRNQVLALQQQMRGQ